MSNRLSFEHRGRNLQRVAVLIFRISIYFFTVLYHPENVQLNCCSRSIFAKQKQMASIKEPQPFPKPFSKTSNIIWASQLVLISDDLGGITTNRVLWVDQHTAIRRDPQRSADCFGCAGAHFGQEPGCRCQPQGWIEWRGGVMWKGLRFSLPYLP